LGKIQKRNFLIYINKGFSKNSYSLNLIRRKWMAFKDIFKDENDINEKSVVGFASFAIMTLFAFADLATGYFGKDLVINEFIYNSFVIITLGSFGIAEAGKIFGKKE
tara:strand:- start:550 stop:870 length:321 start_codon:yes stop_codon:yes gene_type:complete